MNIADTQHKIREQLKNMEHVHEIIPNRFISTSPNSILHRGNFMNKFNILFFQSTFFSILFYRKSIGLMHTSAENVV